MNIDPLVPILLLFALLAIVVGPIIGFAMLFKRIKSSRGRVILTASSLGIPFALLFFFGFVGSSRARAERDHSFTLPASASHIQCSGLVSITTFGDFSADTSFDIASHDLPSLLSQAKWDVTPEAQGVETLSRSMSIPSRFNSRSATRHGMSRDGNSVSMETYDLGESRVGVCIYTSWN